VTLRPAGVADHPGEIADQEHDVVPQVLELAHFVEDDRVPEVQVRRRRVEPGLDPQRLPLGELAPQVLLLDELIRAPPHRLDLC
jgi:hypothetical protein